MADIKITLTKERKPLPDPDTLVFGKTFTDHMFLMNYDAGQGWHDARIVPYGPLTLDPSCMVFHYAQELFEGMKAYRTPEGKIQLFRPIENARRFNSSCDRMCIPPIDEDFFVEAVKTVVNIDKEWVPHKKGASLYIRPFVFATDPSLGVHASHSYLFAIILCPVGNYYAEGLNPVKIYVETEDVHRKYVEEVGAMNVMFKINGKVVTPALTGSVLPGITRKSCIELLRDWGIPVEERLIEAKELFDAARSGQLEEAWGTGTAAVVSPIGELAMGGEKDIVSGGHIGHVTQRLYDTLTGIQWGTEPDPYGWTVPVE